MFVGGKKRQGELRPDAFYLDDGNFEKQLLPVKNSDILNTQAVNASESVDVYGGKEKLGGPRDHFGSDPHFCHFVWRESGGRLPSPGFAGRRFSGKVGAALAPNDGQR